MVNTLVIGGEGQVGRELLNLFDGVSFTSHKKGTPEFLAIEDRESLMKCVQRNSPDIIINAVAATNVDVCEKDRSMAYDTNGIAVRNIVDAARRLNSRLVHISTDYVFEGTKGNYSEVDVPNPVNFYGLSKLVGDVFVQSYENSLIVRTSGVYGNKSNFPYYVVNNLRSGRHMDIFESIYSPIHAKNLARAISLLSDTRRTGIVNIAGDRISRIEFARQIARSFNLDETLLREVKRIESMRAKRPYDSSLTLSKGIGMINFDFHSIQSNLKNFIESYDKIE